MSIASIESEYKKCYPKNLGILTGDSVDCAVAVIEGFRCQDALILVPDIDVKKCSFILVALKPVNFDFWGEFNKVKAVKKVNELKANDRRIFMIRLQGGVLTTAIVAKDEVIWMANILSSADLVVQFHVRDDNEQNYFPENYGLVDCKKWKYF